MLTGSPPAGRGGLPKNWPTLKFVDMSLQIRLDLVFGNILKEAGKKEVQTRLGVGQALTAVKEWSEDMSPRKAHVPVTDWPGCRRSEVTSPLASHRAGERQTP